MHIEDYPTRRTKTFPVLFVFHYGTWKIFNDQVRNYNFILGSYVFYTIKDI